VGGQQLGGRLGLATGGDLPNGCPRGEQGVAFRKGGRAGLGPAHEKLGDLPLAGTGLFDGDIFDGGRAGAVDQIHLAAQHLSDDAHLTTALLEPLHVDQAGGDDLTRADTGNATDRQEDMTAARNFDDEPDDTGRLRGAVDDKNVANPTDLVAGGVENGTPGQAGDEDSGRTHGTTLAFAWKNGRVSSQSLFSRRGQAFPSLPRGEVLGTYDTYLEAQSVVDRLSKAEFPVKQLAIVGNDLKTVERVTGKLT